jgi:hypothetical protein
LCRQLIDFAEQYGMQNIYLTGHSLGGATASMVAIMLKDMIESTPSPDDYLQDELSHVNNDSPQSPREPSTHTASPCSKPIEFDDKNSKDERLKNLKDGQGSTGGNFEVFPETSSEAGPIKSEEKHSNSIRDINDGHKNSFQSSQKSDGDPINVHCYAYGSAAAFSEELAGAYDDLIDSFVLGEDVVPHLSFGSFLDIQTMLVHAATISNSTTTVTAQKYEEILPRLVDCRDAVLAASPRNPRLYPAGRIHHLLDLHDPTEGGISYTVADTCVQTRFNEIEIRKNMVNMHMPSRYDGALENAYLTLLTHELEERKVSVPMRTLPEIIKAVIQRINDEAAAARDSGHRHLSYELQDT